MAHHPTSPPRSSAIAFSDFEITHTPAPYAGSGIAGLASGLMFPFGGSTAAFPLRWHGVPAPPIGEAYDAVTKVIVANVLDAVGYGAYEKGIFDAPQPGVHPVLSGPSIIVEKPGPDVSSEADLPVFLPSWPDEWKKQPGDPAGWDPDQWEYPPDNGGEDVAIDWGSVFSGAVDIAQGQVIGGGQAAPAPSYYMGGSQVGTGNWGGSAPAKVTVDTATGKVTPCRRRRRRRLLTPTDLNDLAALKTIVGGGQAINFAVMKAVRR